MTEYAKCFLSHKSEDKSLVNEVANLLPQSRIELDSLTFEYGKTSAGEIQASLSRSQLFVLFASKDAMESPWIQSEIEYAQQLYFKKQLKGVLVFIIDENLPIKQISNWLRAFVVMKTKNALRISNTIKTKLIQIDASAHLVTKPYVTRSKLNEELENKLANALNPTRGIYTSGVEGIGRKTFVTNVLLKLYQGADILGVTVPVFDGEGLLEAYRKLYLQWNNPTPKDYSTFLDETSQKSSDEIADNFTLLVNEIGSKKSFVWLQFDSSAITDEGEIEPQFLTILKKLNTNRPTLIVRARKSPKLTEQKKTPNISYIKVPSLTDEESKRLWYFALQYHNVEPIDEEIVSYLLEQISGHPNLIWMAAEYVAQIGVLTIRANPKKFNEELSKLSMSLIDGLPLTPSARKVLSLFDEFGTISLEDLQIIFGNDSNEQDLTDAVTSLISYSLLEMDETHFRIAPYFQHTRFRKAFSVEVDPFLNLARKKLFEVVSAYNSEDSLSFSTIDSVIISAINDNKSLPANWNENAIVGSHYLRLARSYYDRRKYEETVKYAQLAYDKAYTLTDYAKIEVLRLLGISSIRIESPEHKDFALKQLQDIGTAQSKKHIAFIKGFEARSNGNFDIAEQEFRQVLLINPGDNHALRELSQILMNREDFHQAESMVRQALQVSPDNPFLLDILLKCLIELKKNDLHSLREDEEIQELFTRLEIADARENNAFHPLRYAQYLAALKMYNDALQAADKAVSKNVQLVYALATRAEIKMEMRHDKNIQISAIDDINQISKISNGKAHLTLISKLKIRYELSLSNHANAMYQYNKTSIFLGKFKKIIGLEIASRIINDNISEKELVDWANKFMETSNQ